MINEEGAQAPEWRKRCHTHTYEALVLWIISCDTQTRIVFENNTKSLI